MYWEVEVNLTHVLFSTIWKRVFNFIARLDTFLVPTAFASPAVSLDEVASVGF
jgi:hypothetical protein